MSSSQSMQSTQSADRADETLDMSRWVNVNGVGEPHNGAHEPLHNGADEPLHDGANEPLYNGEGTLTEARQCAWAALST